MNGVSQSQSPGEWGDQHRKNTTQETLPTVTKLVDRVTPRSNQSQLSEIRPGAGGASRTSLRPSRRSAASERAPGRTPTHTWRIRKRVFARLLKTGGSK